MSNQYKCGFLKFSNVPTASTINVIQQHTYLNTISHHCTLCELICQIMINGIAEHFAMLNVFRLTPFDGVLVSIYNVVIFWNAFCIGHCYCIEYATMNYA